MPEQRVTAEADEPRELSATTRILRACRKEIALNGVRGLRVQAVAKRAGVSLGLVYYHFQDRSGLLNATLDSVNQAAQGRGGSPSPGELTQNSLERTLLAELSDDAENHEDAVVWNEIRAIAVFETELQPALHRTTEQWHLALLPSLAQAGVPEATQDACAALFTTLVEGLSSRWLSGQITSQHAQSLMRSAISAIVMAHSEQPPAAPPGPAASN